MKLLSAIFILAISPTIFAKENRIESSFEGKYICKGYDFETKQPYEERGVLKRTKNTYSFLRSDPHLGVFYATGIVKNSVISFVFWNEKNNHNFGIASYERLPNGDLKGIWTLKDSTIVGEDNCTRIKE